MDEFAKRQYKTIRGRVKETVAADALKPSGYTRDNINARINGVNTEIQVGGKFTTKWGDAEHFLYDIRQGKKLDLSELTPEQIKIVKKYVISFLFFFMVYLHYYLIIMGVIHILQLRK